MACELERDPERYQGILRDAFEKHYTEGSDVWTADEEMASFPAAVQFRLSLPTSSSVLDLGCGSGRDVATFARWFTKVVGIDLYAHGEWDNVRARYPSVHFHAVDFLDFETDDRFELIFDNGCFHHQHPARTGQYLERVTERLTPSGHYVLSTFKNPAFTRRVDANGRLHRYFMDEELHQELLAAHLVPTSEFSVPRPRHGDHYRVTFCTKAHP